MRTVLAVIFVAVFAPRANGQTIVAYAEGGPAGFSNFAGRWFNTFHVAGGGEGIVAGRVGVGGEIGFFQRVITASGNATFHLTPPSSSKTDAFITGGYTRFGIRDVEGGFHAWNVGVGANAWFGDHAGLRVELRDHIRPDSRGATQYWSVRAGLAVR
jgi:hypothetical protein